MVELRPVPFPEPGEAFFGGELELSEGGEMAVHDAVADLEEVEGELEGFAGGEPCWAVAGEFGLGVC